MIAFLHTSFSPPAGSITFIITGLKSDRGTVLISLFDNEKHFPKNAGKAIGKARSAIRNGTATVTFRDLPYGKFAAAMMHDENGNKEMDYNMLGMPKEGYGFSNNAKATLSPPSFEKASIILDGDEKRTTIKVTYL